ncbi:MAG: glycosyl transferase family 2 [Clostridia bacterium]|nr:glycosyl transferase family 2 [Clostridia bacterium]
MDKKLCDVLNGREENYLMPFYWQRGDHAQRIPEQIQRIYDSGCRAFCVESRPHPDFVGETWWRDMDVILAEAGKRDMKVWLLDDDKFPTGHAAGMIAKEHPELRQWELIEIHVDVVGPSAETSVLVRAEDEENILLGVYAYRRRADDGETCLYEAIPLTERVKGSYLTWDIPEGVWRIFFYYKSRNGGRAEYIDTINPDSVRVLIDAVYESHWKRYGQYFGNTFAGFFSDEPQLGNRAVGRQRFSYGSYEQRIGKHGLALPWNENVHEMMKASLGMDPLPHLNLLWYEDGENGNRQAELRHAYMDAVTRLYSACFNKQIADWCHAHGVQYIGHIIEDMNCHMGSGVGHYFRALQWQDMSGIDVVLHQVMPGMSDYLHSTVCATGVYSGSFFDYILAKQGASLAHLTPSMSGKAMCEVFGAYGWGEDSTMMKYLIDHLLVRGINHFVPHAFSPSFPDRDCPPHFGAEGHDPSFEAFTALMRYTNQAAHLLSDTTHIANAAILYHVDGEWASRFGNASNMEPVATRLYDAHIDYDIVSLDMLLHAAGARDGKLLIHQESFDCLIVPYADHMPNTLLDTLKNLSDSGIPVWFMRAMPENAKYAGEVVSEDALVDKMIRLGMTDVIVEGEYPKLRIYHCRRNENDLYMFVNEDYSKTVDTTCRLIRGGAYARLDLLTDLCVSGETKGGALPVRLLPNQSQIVVLGDRAGLPEEYDFIEEEKVSPIYQLELAESDDLTSFKAVGTFDHFFNINSPDFMPDFSGKMRYTFLLALTKGKGRTFLDLGRVGQNAVLYVNDRCCGIRITAPYLFDITDAIVEGETELVVTVSNTLAQKVKDKFSYNLQLKPSGLLGDICVKKTK